MSNFFDNTSIVEALLKRKWHIVVVTVAAAICGYVFSGPSFITPMFKSEAILYPANGEYAINEEFTEQMMQIILSQDIRDSIIAKFDLVKHYGIAENDPYLNTKVNKKISNNVKVSKTTYDAVSLTVLDEDPQTACDIANEMIRIYQLKFDRLDKSKRSERIRAMKIVLDNSKKIIDSLRVRIKEINTTYGVNDPDNQYAEVVKGELGTFEGAAKVDKKALAEMKENILKYGAELKDDKADLDIELKTYSSVKEQYDQEMTLYLGFEPSTNVISHPNVADRKFSPKRSVITAVCGLAALCAAVLIVLSLDGRRKEE